MHVRQATAFAGQTVKFHRSVTGGRHLFRSLVPFMFFDECHSPWLEVFSWSPYKYWQDDCQNDRQDLPINSEIHKD